MGDFFFKNFGLLTIPRLICTLIRKSQAILFEIDCAISCTNFLQYLNFTYVHRKKKLKRLSNLKGLKPLYNVALKLRWAFPNSPIAAIYYIVRKRASPFSIYFFLKLEDFNTAYYLRSVRAIKAVYVPHFSHIKEDFFSSKGRGTKNLYATPLPKISQFFNYMCAKWKEFI